MKEKEDNNLKEKKMWKNINLIQKNEKTWNLKRIETNTLKGIQENFSAKYQDQIDGILQGIDNTYKERIDKIEKDIRNEFELKANEAKLVGLLKYQINFHLKRRRLGGRCFILNASPSKRCLELLEVREPGFPFLKSRFPFHKKHIRECLLLAAGPAGAAEN